MKNTNTKTLTRVALLVAIEVVMKLVGLCSVPMGPLYMSFLTLPFAVGAITMGPRWGGRSRRRSSSGWIFAKCSPLCPE